MDGTNRCADKRLAVFIGSQAVDRRGCYLRIHAHEASYNEEQQ
jgi:hypothetical protein